MLGRGRKKQGRLLGSELEQNLEGGAIAWDAQRLSGREIKSLFFLLIYLFVYLFIYGCVGSSFLCEGFLQLRQAGATLHHGARASHYRGLSCCGTQAPDAQAQ